LQGFSSQDYGCYLAINEEGKGNKKINKNNKPLDETKG
jgi:hypothetical protein